MTIQINDLVGSWAASPPILYYQLRKALDDPDSSFSDFADIISADPALIARLLKIVNSPFYGLANKVETLTHALNIIGTDQLVDLALAAVVVSKFQGIPRDLINMESFWMHSIATGLTARKISEYRDGKGSERLYLAGMMHDIGSLILYKEAPALAKDILTRSKEEKIPLHIVEKEVLGFDHAEVGSLLLSGWKLPTRLVEVVAGHNNPMDAENCSLEASIVNLADCMVYSQGIGNSGETTKPIPDLMVIKMVNLPKETIDLVNDEIADMVDETVRTFF